MTLATRSAVAALSYIAFMAIGALATAFVISQRKTSALEERPIEASAPAVSECDAAVSSCGRFGRRGQCVQERCLLGAGACAQDVDCDDNNVCTTDRCDNGRCVAEARGGACKLSEQSAGVCIEGYCEIAAAPNCMSDRDCIAPTNSCAVATCKAGVCQRERQPNDHACSNAAGKPGVCTDGGCVVGSAPVEAAEKCRLAFDEYVGYYKKCSRGMSFELAPEAIVEIEEKIAKQINESYRYDVRVALSALADGGYNISVFNRRPHSDLRGLCDPSFIAWQVADFTKNSNWKSRNLHIWLKPYAEGWGLSTHGGREAVRQAKSRSSLGWMGVLDAPSFRRWLEKAFYPLAPVAMAKREPVPSVPSPSP